jgi:hypothetical protein
MSVTSPTLKFDFDVEEVADDDADEVVAPPPAALLLELLLLPHAASAATQHSVPTTATARRPKPVKSSPIVETEGAK